MKPTKEQKEAMKELFKITRKTLGLNQIEFSKKIGCTQGALSKIESGKMEPSVYLYLRLTEIFEGEK